MENIFEFKYSTRNTFHEYDIVAMEIVCRHSVLIPKNFLQIMFLVTVVAHLSCRALKPSFRSISNMVLAHLSRRALKPSLT